MRPTAYRRNARGLRDRQAFERVRLQAGALFAPAAPKPRSPANWVSAGRTPAAGTPVAAGGQEALRSAGPTGHAPRLSDPATPDVTQALREGARAHGFDSDHWTLARITR